MKIILKEEISKRLKVIGLNPEKYQSDMNIIEYFLSENIASIYGKNEFSEDEVDLTIMGHSLIINSIFDDAQEIILYTAPSRSGVTLNARNGNTNLFSISVIPEEISNRQTVIEDGETKIHTSTVNLEKEEFSLSVSIDGLEGEIYRASIIPLKANLGEKEYFGLRREIPKPKEVKGIIGKVRSFFTEEQMIRISTPYGISDSVDHIGAIYEKLKEDAKMREDRQQLLLHNKDFRELT